MILLLYIYNNLSYHVSYIIYINDIDYVLYIICITTDLPPAYLCITCIPGACICQKRGLDLLELELWVVVSSSVSAGK